MCYARARSDSRKQNTRLAPPPHCDKTGAWRKVAPYSGSGKVNRFLLGSLIVLGGTLGVVASAHAADADGVALCVSCTTNVQFEAAAKQAAGTQFNGTERYLVVNPDSGLSKWVMVTNTPAGQIPLNTRKPAPMPYGVAVPVASNPFANIYVAGQTPVHTGSTVDRTSAQASDLTQAQKLGVETIIQVTKNTYVVTLNPVQFPSYERSNTVALANADYAALVAATNEHWPVSVFTQSLYDLLHDSLGVYFGHSGKVCNIFANGDDVCTTPVPTDKDNCNQNGPARNQASAALPDVCNRVAGGGGAGMTVTPTHVPGEYDYVGPAGIVWVDCYWSNGKFLGCYAEKETD